MRHAIVSDIHSHAESLQRVLADAAAARAGRVICLGDVVGYGPDPAKAVDIVRREAAACLAGNHDAAVCGKRTARDFNRYASAAATRNSAAISKKDMKWLASLPSVYEAKAPSGEPLFACTHGDFTHPEAFIYIAKPQDALASFAARPEPLLFVGHTHEPAVFRLSPDGRCEKTAPRDFTLENGFRYIVNPGSTGYPRHGECKSSYCIFDDSTRTVEFRSVPFDLEGYAKRMDEIGAALAPWMRAELDASRALSAFRSPPPPPPPPARRRRRFLSFALAAIALASVAGIALSFILDGNPEQEERPQEPESALSAPPEEEEDADATGSADDEVPLEDSPKVEETDRHWSGKKPKAEKRRNRGNNKARQNKENQRRSKKSAKNDSRKKRNSRRKGRKG